MPCRRSFARYPVEMFKLSAFLVLRHRTQRGDHTKSTGRVRSNVMSATCVVGYTWYRTSANLVQYDHEPQERLMTAFGSKKQASMSMAWLSEEPHCGPALPLNLLTRTHLIRTTVIFECVSFSCIDQITLILVSSASLRAISFYLFVCICRYASLSMPLHSLVFS